MTQQFNRIGPADLYARMDSDPKTTLLDVRSTAEYRAGHIKGASSLPLDELSTENITDSIGAPKAGTDEPLYLTCKAGLRSQQAAEKLNEAGYDNLVLLEGGTDVWQEVGLPMQRCGTAISLERQVQITIGALLILKVVFGFTIHELFFALSALIGAGLITAGITRWCGMAKLIARMPWNQRKDCAGHARHTQLYS